MMGKTSARCSSGFSLRRLTVRLLLQTTPHSILLASPRFECIKGRNMISRIRATKRRRRALGTIVVALFTSNIAAAADHADLIIHHGKIITVDEKFSIGQALAVKGDRILSVGSNAEILKLAGP